MKALFVISSLRFFLSSSGKSAPRWSTAESTRVGILPAQAPFNAPIGHCAISQRTPQIIGQDIGFDSTALPASVSCAVFMIVFAIGKYTF